MRDLMELQTSLSGRRFLQDEMIFDNPDQFVDHLKPPVKPIDAHARAGGLAIYAHQQVYLDYPDSVVAKVLLLRGLRDCYPSIEPHFIWIDTDRSGSDKLTLRLYFHTLQGKVPVRLAPAGCERIEPRFIQLNPARLEDGLARIEKLIAHSAVDRAVKQRQFKRLVEATKCSSDLVSLSRSITNHLFAETLDFVPKHICLSKLMEAKPLRFAIEEIINRQVEFVEIVNARIAQLKELNIASQLRPLPQDYLPLFMTCPEDRSRLRLRLKRDFGRHFAFAQSRSGTRHLFDLGEDNLSIEQLEEQVAWSPDVTLPILLNDHYSGMIAGKSSGLYMLVLRYAMQRLLRKQPVPILVPTHWHPTASESNSLLDVYLRGQKLARN